MTEFKKGDVVETLEKYQDPGDELLTWMVMDGSEKGRAPFVAVDSPISLKPRYLVDTSANEFGGSQDLEQKISWCKESIAE